MLSGMERRFQCGSCATKWFTVRDEPPGDCQRCGGTLEPLRDDAVPTDPPPYGERPDE
jgi:hypothetical protein